jgi:uncharacterized protein
MEERGSLQTRIWPYLASSIVAKTSIFLAPANAEGHPYIQHGGGPPGFLKSVDDKTLGLADLAGLPRMVCAAKKGSGDRILPQA